MLLGAACQKVDLPVADEKQPAETSVPATGDGDDSPVVLPEEYVDAMTVAEVQSAYSYVETSDKELCAVIGYIVGYADASMKNACFTAEGAVESNILIADHKGETRSECCLPVQLVKGEQIRDELNLAKNPGALGARIYIAGFISKYYATVGMRDPQYYEWVTEEDDEQDEDEPAPSPGTDPTPDPDPGTETKDTLGIDDEPSVIPGGRAVVRSVATNKPCK